MYPAMTVHGGGGDVSVGALVKVASLSPNILSTQRLIDVAGHSKD
jgi:hypothetical protein